MNNDFKNEFNNYRKNQNDSRMIFEFAAIREYLSKDYLACFIEGPDDKKFYRFIRNKNIFREIDKDNYIYADKNKDEVLGKKAVLLTYDYIKNNYNDSLDKCIFIVDHDYNGLNDYKLDKNCITMTKTYSIENYYLDKDNLYIIFDYLGKKNDYNKFMNIVKGFIEELSEFVRLKSTITNIGNNSGVRYFNIYSNTDIFRFDFKKVPFYNIRLMDEEISNMTNSIKMNSYAMNYYNYQALKFCGKSEWVRGHDIYKLLKYYVMYNYRIDIDDNRIHSDIVKLLNIDIDIKNGIGEELN